MKMLLPRLAVLVLGLFVAQPGVAASHTEKTIKIRSLGQAPTSISQKPVTDLADLQAQVVKYRNALQVALAQSDFDGDPADVFQAVADGKVEKVSNPAGTTYEWMVFRKKGQPAIMHNVEWAPRNGKDFEAWRMTVEGKDNIYTFDIPSRCLNIALTSAPVKKERPAPTCTLSASYAPATCDQYGTITITGDNVASVSGGATGSGTSWTVTPTRAGSYSFTGTTPEAYGKTGTCESAAINVPAPDPCPKLVLGATFDPTSGLITVDGKGSIGDVEITGITTPDGPGDLTQLSPAGDKKWTYPPEVPCRGDGVPFTFDGTASSGNYPSDSGSASVTVPPRAEWQTGKEREECGRWVLRVFGALIDGDGDDSTSDILASGVNRRSELSLGSGSGAGIGIEFLATKRIGIEASYLYGEIDSDFKLDLDNDWAMDSDDLAFRPLTLGLNFHLTPDSKADFFVGPFIGLVQYGTGKYDALNEWVMVPFDDDFGWGVNVGVDVPFSDDSRWGFTSSLRYMSTTAEDENGIYEIDFDPLIFSAGVAIRF